MKAINHPTHISEARAKDNMSEYKQDARIINRTWGSNMAADGLSVYLGAVPGSGSARSTGYRKCPMCGNYIHYSN